MTYPPPLPPTSRTDATLSATNHAQDHNRLASALKDFLTELGPSPSGTYGNLTERLLGIAAGQDAAAMAEFERLYDLVKEVSDIETPDALVAALINLGDTSTNAALNNAIVNQIADDETVKDAAALAMTEAVYVNRPSRNLVDPAAAQAGYTMTSSGAAAASANYTLTDYIPVTAGQPVTIAGGVNRALYNASKTFVSGTYAAISPEGATVTITPAADGYVRSSARTANLGTFQVEYGSEATAWEPYGEVRSIDPAFSESVATAVGANGAIAVTKAGHLVTLASKVGGVEMVQSLALTGSKNGAVNLTGITHGGTVIAAQTDEVTPIGTQNGQVGGNHGYNRVRAFTNPDGKTTADLGSVWSDGTREYVLLAIQDGKLVLGGHYTTSGGVTTTATVAPAAALTHVSGATKTGTIDHTTLASVQLYPSVQRVRVSLWLDDKEVTADGTYGADEVIVREVYEVLDYGSLYDTAKANIGVAISDRTIAGAVRVTNAYRWTAGLRCRVSTTLTEMRPTTLGDTGTVQAIALARSGYTCTRYLPGVGTISGEDWTAGVDLSTHSTNMPIGSPHLTGAPPPAFALDVLSTSGSTSVGFALGHYPEGIKGTEASTNAERMDRTPDLLWMMSSADKSYPYISDSTAAGWGRLASEGFRVYLSPTQVAAVLAAKSDALAAWDALDAVASLT